MLVDEYYCPRLSEFDQQIFRTLVPRDHFLHRAQQAIPWDSFYDVLAPYYQADVGRPAESPVLMLKLEYLRYHDNLADREHPEAGDRTLSIVDAEARCGKHGQWYDGYVIDVLLAPDSRLFTELNLLSAGGDEAADAITLVRQEEETHGNDVEALSMDGAGFNGPMLRELEAPNGLAVNVIVPPQKEPASEFFAADDFVTDAATGRLSCPAGVTATHRERDAGQHGWIHRFPRKACEACPLLARCMKNPPRGHYGRKVRKNDYEPEYRRVRQKVGTAAYQQIRAEHPLVERKLGELLNRHGGRRARYWGAAKILIQELMAALATNVREIVRWFCAPTVAAECES